MDYSNPAVTLFRDLGGLDNTIKRLKFQVTITIFEQAVISKTDFILDNMSKDEMF